MKEERGHVTHLPVAFGCSRRSALLAQNLESEEAHRLKDWAYPSKKISSAGYTETSSTRFRIAASLLLLCSEMPDVNGPAVPPGPPDRLMKRLKEGYVLRDHEIEMLNEHGAIAAQLEMSDPNFARGARKWRAEWQGAERAEAMRNLLAAKKNTSDTVQKRRDQDMRDMKQARIYTLFTWLGLGLGLTLTLTLTLIPALTLAQP